MINKKQHPAGDSSTEESKKKINDTKQSMLLTLEILRQYSDYNNRLTQKDMINLLMKIYGFSIGEKALRDNLNRLIELGYNVAWDESERFDKHGESSIKRTDWYYEHTFSDSELLFLMDSVMYAKYVPISAGKEIINKLEGLTSKYFKHNRTLPLSDPRENHLLLVALEAVNEAIDLRCKISFIFNEYGEDKVLHPSKDENGEISVTTISPYRIAIKNERFYVICAYGDENSTKKLYSFRLDRMSHISILEERVRPLSSVLGTGRELNINNYIKTRIYMHSGDNERIVFRADKIKNPNIVAHIIDWLGKDVEFKNSTNESVDVVIYSNHMDMFYWALQYGLSVEILSPSGLREKVRNAVSSMYEKYNMG